MDADRRPTLSAVERTRTKHLVLILARELAANVATPMLLVDPDQVLVFFNEAAEQLLGETFAGTGETSVVSWGRRHAPERLDGTPYPLAEFPLSTALLSKRPAHDSFRFVGADGVKREVTAAAYPLLAQSDEFAGAVVLFWQRG
jgi:PAS domain-containing protein